MTTRIGLNGFGRMRRLVLGALRHHPEPVLTDVNEHRGGVLDDVMGCNDHLYDPLVHDIVTAASCTTNCVAPVVKVLHESIGIQCGAITTMHDATNAQVMVDAPHKDLRRARSALNSLIPTSAAGSPTQAGR